MDATAVSNAHEAGASRNASGTKVRPDAAAQLDYNAFLQLLIAQMQNQDPMEPMNSSDYVAQLATFSQVEKTIQTNERVADLLSAVRLQQAEAVIGRTVTSADGQMSGTVVAARVSGSAVVAILRDGREIAIESGVTVSERAL